MIVTRQKKWLRVFIPGIMFLGCISRTTVIENNSTAQPLTEECRMQNEICQEALDFQREYERMPQEEREEMNSVLNTYIEHCEKAKKACEESLKHRENE